jgi:transcriptional regulator with XRE-family HTH domain
MSTQRRLGAVLTAWAENPENSQIKFARIVNLAPSGVSRMFKGEQHPDLGTFASMLAALGAAHPQLVHDLLEAYLLDHIPEGTAPDGRPWTILVRIIVDEIISARSGEVGPACAELDLAKAWWTHRLETPDGQRWLLTLYRWAVKAPTRPYGQQAI